MQDIKKIIVFLSSPSDLLQERKLAENAIKDTDKYHFEIFDFSKVASEFGDKPQNIINAQLPDFDIYIGIMGQRFGTPTDSYGSGTEEEFRIALEKKKSGKSVHVALLFKTIENPVSSMSVSDLAQFMKVRDFQTSVSSEGAYQSFGNEDELSNHVRQIINRFVADCNSESTEQMYQAEMLTEIPSRDVFAIDKTYFSSVLNSVGAELTNGHRAIIQLEDVYVPLDLTTITKLSDETHDISDNEIVSATELDNFSGHDETKLFIVGDESSGKSTLCKRMFLHFHQKGLVPVCIQGADIKNASASDLKKIIERAFAKQYRERSLARYNALEKNNKVIIVDDIDESSLNNKHRILLIKELEKTYSHIVCTADQLFLFNVRHFSSRRSRVFV